MDSEGQQLHPNWRALATIHIPLKRFIKEGTVQVDRGTHSSQHLQKHAIQGVDAKEIKVFYEELVRNDNKTKTNDKKTKNVQAQKRKIEKEKLFPKKEFNVNEYFRAAQTNNLKALEDFDYVGQNIDVCDNFGWSALMMAACEGCFDSCCFLLRLGVNCNIRDKSGNSAKNLAIKKGHLRIKELLEASYKTEELHTQTPVQKQIQEFNKLDPFYCELCKRSFTETTLAEHQTSTIHQFNTKSSLPPNKLQKFNIPERNKGLKLMVKQGWDKESGLGPSQDGRLYPVKTVIRKQRSGLGTQQDVARVTHFEAFDRKAVQRHKSDFYRKKARNRNDIRREKIVDWKKNRRLRNELS